MKISRILCPIDFSETSRHALEHAVAVAKWYDAQIVALHVIHTSLLPTPPILFAEFATSSAPAVMNQLYAWLEPARKAGVNVNAIVDEGNPTVRIVERATTERADLIVMGTHGVGGFERLILGSVTERVLRKAPCPVLVVPPASQTTAKVPYARLLCPVDFSESSLAALRFSFSLAEEADARITLLHVVDFPADDELVLLQVDVNRFRDLVEGQTKKRLDALITDDMKTWSKPCTRVTYGKSYREIVDVARDENSDLIVMGVRGRNPVDLTIFGSTTNHVVRMASCPVLTVRA